MLIKKKNTPINDDIRVSEVMLIDENGKNKGMVGIDMLLILQRIIT